MADEVDATAERMEREQALMRPALCSCGCSREPRPGARYYSAACRAKASRARSGAALLSEYDVKVIRYAVKCLQGLAASDGDLPRRLEVIAARSEQMRLALRSGAHVRDQGGDGRLGRP